MIRVSIVSITILVACTTQEPSTTPRAPTPSSTSTIDEQVGLPADVAEVRAGILAAAECGDYDLLRPYLDPAVFLSDFGFGSSPIARWARIGERPLRTMAALLDMGYAEEDTNEGHLYRWPSYDAETGSLDDMLSRDRRRFLSIMTRQELRRLLPNEEYGYVGPRLGILSDGTWWFFILEAGP